MAQANGAANLPWESDSERTCEPAAAVVAAFPAKALELDGARAELAMDVRDSEHSEAVRIRLDVDISRTNPGHVWSAIDETNKFFT